MYEEPSLDSEDLEVVLEELEEDDTIDLDDNSELKLEGDGELLDI